MTSGISSGIVTSTRAPSRSGERTRPDGTRREPRLLERGPQDLVDEQRDRPERRAARPQDRGVEALQQLAGDVERDVRSGLEVRADGADRDPPLADPEAVLERPRADLALERLDLGDGLDLLGETLEAGVVQAQPVEHPLVDAARSRLAVGCVRGEDLCPSLPHEYGCALQGGGDRLVGQTRCGTACLARLLLDRLA